jgi:hypothetical protein
MSNMEPESMQREEKMDELKPGFFRKQDSDYEKSMKSMWVLMQMPSLDTLLLLCNFATSQHRQLAPAPARILPLTSFLLLRNPQWEHHGGIGTAGGAYINQA